MKKITLERLLEFRCIVFDFDGTLCDTVGDIRKAFREAALSCGLDPDKMKPITVGPPLERSLRQAIGDEIDDPLLEKLQIAYRRFYNDSDFEESPLYPGAIELVELLKSRKKFLALATNKSEEATLKILSLKGLSPLLDRVLCYDSENRFWTKAEMIGSVLQISQCPKEECIFFGDAANDIKGGKLAGVATTAALYGYGSVEELLESGPDYTCEDLSDLLAGT